MTDYRDINSKLYEIVVNKIQPTAELLRATSCDKVEKIGQLVIDRLSIELNRISNGAFDRMKQLNNMIGVTSENCAVYLSHTFKLDFFNPACPVAYININTSDQPVWKRLDEMDNDIQRQSYKFLLGEWVRAEIISEEMRKGVLESLGFKYENTFFRFTYRGMIQAAQLTHLILEAFNIRDVLNYIELKELSEITATSSLPTTDSSNIITDEKIREIQSELHSKSSTIALIKMILAIAYDGLSALDGVAGALNARKQQFLRQISSKKYTHFRGGEGDGEQISHESQQDIRRTTLEAIRGVIGEEYFIALCFTSPRFDLKTVAQVYSKFKPNEEGLRYWLSQQSQYAFTAILMAYHNNIKLNQNTLKFSNILGDPSTEFKFAQKSVFRRFVSHAGIYDMMRWTTDPSRNHCEQRYWRAFNLLFQKFPQCQFNSDQLKQISIGIFNSRMAKSNQESHTIRAEDRLLNLDNAADILYMMANSEIDVSVVADYALETSKRTGKLNASNLHYWTTDRRFAELHRNWVAELNCERYEELKRNPHQVNHYTIIAISLKSGKCESNYIFEHSGFRFEQILSDLELLEESILMNHCAYTYDKLCTLGSYLIFRAFGPDGERATLGLSHRRFRVNRWGESISMPELRVEFHQIYCAKNHQASEQIRKAAKEFSKLIQIEICGEQDQQIA